MTFSYCINYCDARTTNFILLCNSRYLQLQIPLNHLWQMGAPTMPTSLIYFEAPVPSNTTLDTIKEKWMNSTAVAWEQMPLVTLFSNPFRKLLKFALILSGYFTGSCHIQEDFFILRKEMPISDVTKIRMVTLTMCRISA